MSNYDIVDYEHANGELRSLYDEIKTTLKLQRLPNWVTHMGGTPHIAKAMWHMLKPVVTSGNLSPLLQELILFCVAFHRKVPYCMALHSSNILRLTESLDAEDLREIIQHNSPGLIPDSYQQALEVVADLATLQSRFEADKMQRLRGAGFSLVQAIEITNLVSIALYMNAYTIAADLPIDETLTPWSSH